ncbi:MAG TPA: outer membrane lipoprotein carrier protein LolA [Polyangiaceae bacterium]|jgi:hypothetical protein|nr:outer membrane lipoprotein carrier protein LolA [Polyangiaceae bacterium]
MSGARVSRRAMLSGSAGFVAAFAAARVGRAGSIDDLLGRIARARSSVRTLKGPFTQTRTIGLLSTDVRSIGTLALVRPDRLRWELAPPDAVTFWIGPEGLAYRSQHGQGSMPASSARIAASLQDLHALLGGDLAKLSDRWNLTLIRDEAAGAEIEARARSAAGASGVPRTIRFALAPDLVRPVRALLVEGEHDRTTVEFGEVAVNAPIEDSAMRPPS